MSESKTVYIIDVESGNLKSLENAIKRIGNYLIVFIRDAQDFLRLDAGIELLLFPGVGNYGHFVAQIHARDLAGPIRAYIDSGRALMGICVGLQALFDNSEESTDANLKGFGYVSAPLSLFHKNDVQFTSRGLLKSVPHIGWNSVSEIDVDNQPLEKNQAWYGINTTSKYYFVHSYAAIVNDETRPLLQRAMANGWNFAYSRYGSETFVAALGRNNVLATQFHPEKSGAAGLRVLKCFLEGQTLLQAPQAVEIGYTSLGLTRRVIACLDVRANDAGDLVVTKGDQYNVRESDDDGNGEVRNLGKPVELATRYYVQGADEVTFLNITLFRESPLKDLPMLQVLSKAAETIFVPLTVGGGIRDTIDPGLGKLVPAAKVAELYFLAGADKVSIGSDAVLIAEDYYANDRKKRGTLSIETIAATFGVQAVVISVDPKRTYLKSPSETKMLTIKIANPTDFGPNGEEYCYYQVTSQGGRKVHELGALELCQACEDLGAGEILLNLIDHDGSNRGFNLQLIDQIKRNVSIPVIASSGAGKPEHFAEVFNLDCGVDAALGAGLFHRGEYEVNDVKRYLQDKAGMSVRLDTAGDI